MDFFAKQFEIFGRNAGGVAKDICVFVHHFRRFAHGNTLAEYSDIKESYEKTHSEEKAVQHIGQFFFLSSKKLSTNLKNVASEATCKRNSSCNI